MELRMQRTSRSTATAMPIAQRLGPLRQAQAAMPLGSALRRAATRAFLVDLFLGDLHRLLHDRRHPLLHHLDRALRQLRQLADERAADRPLVELDQAVDLLLAERL